MPGQANAGRCTTRAPANKGCMSAMNVTKRRHGRAVDAKLTAAQVGRVDSDAHRLHVRQHTSQRHLLLNQHLNQPRNALQLRQQAPPGSPTGGGSAASGQPAGRRIRAAGVCHGRRCAFAAHACCGSYCILGIGDFAQCAQGHSFQRLAWHRLQPVAAGVAQPSCEPDVDQARGQRGAEAQQALQRGVLLLQPNGDAEGERAACRPTTACMAQQCRHRLRCWRVENADGAAARAAALASAAGALILCPGPGQACQRDVGGPAVTPAEADAEEGALPQLLRCSRPALVVHNRQGRCRPSSLLLLLLSGCFRCPLAAGSLGQAGATRLGVEVKSETEAAQVCGAGQLAAQSLHIRQLGEHLQAAPWQGCEGRLLCPSAGTAAAAEKPAAMHGSSVLLLPALLGSLPLQRRLRAWGSPAAWLLHLVAFGRASLICLILPLPMLPPWLLEGRCQTRAFRLLALMLLLCLQRLCQVKLLLCLQLLLLFQQRLHGLLLQQLLPLLPLILLRKP